MSKNNILFHTPDLLTQSVCDDIFRGAIPPSYWQGDGLGWVGVRVTWLRVGAQCHVPDTSASVVMEDKQAYLTW